MSQQRERLDIEELPAPVCDTCGTPIDQDDRDCPALDKGRCRP